MDGNTYSEIANFLFTHPQYIVAILGAVVGTIIFSLHEPKPQTTLGMVLNVFFGVITGIVSMLAVLGLMWVLEEPMAQVFMVGIILLGAVVVLTRAISGLLK